MRRNGFGLNLGVAGVVALSTIFAVPSAVRAETALQVAAPDEAAVDAGALVAKSKAAVEAFRSSPVSATFVQSIRSSRAVLVIPKFERAGLGLGGEGGTGVLLSRIDGTDDWTYPAFFEAGGATQGPQIGYEKGTLLIVIHNEQTLDEIMNGELAFGAEARALAGSKGVVAQTVTTGGNRIDLFLRGTGAFAGAVLKDGEIRPVKRLNVGYYGKGTEPADVLSAKGRKNLQADGLRAALTALAIPSVPAPTN